MTRGTERNTLVRLQRNVVCLALCLTFGVVFSKPGMQVINNTYDLVTSSLSSWSHSAKNLTDDGDEPEKVKVTHSLPKRSPKQHSTNSCPYNEFKNLRDECVCYEEETNFVGTTFARADDVETYQACQKLCMSQASCEYWSHYTGNENSNSCLLKRNIMAVSRKSDNDDSVNYVSGTKNCNVPITKDVRYNPPQERSETTEDDTNTSKETEEKNIHRVIAEHCLPKLVCELHRKSADEFDSFSESERSLMSLIGGTTISGTPSKYHFAAHFGQLIRGIETQSCMNFYPQCPFSEHDVRTIARKIAKIR